MLWNLSAKAQEKKDYTIQHKMMHFNAHFIDDAFLGWSLILCYSIAFFIFVLFECLIFYPIVMELSC